MTIGPHAMIHVRHLLPGHYRAIDLKKVKDGTPIKIAGMVICRQHPGTAKGHVFQTFEDETGLANIIISPKLFDSNRLIVSKADYLIVHGLLQNQDGVIMLRLKNSSS